jgi:hypothetical protein
MADQFDDFDDFKPADDNSYVSEALGKVLEKEQSEVESFKDGLDDQLMMAESPKDELTEIVVGYIQGVGDLNQVNLCSYNSTNGVALDGWGFSGDDEETTVDLLLTLYVDPTKSKRISASEIDRHFNWLQRFYDQSLSGSIFSKIEDDKSDLFEVATLINKTNHIDRIRLFILTNAIMPNDYEKDTIELEVGTTCEFYVWDAKRIMQQDNIISGRNPIVVNFETDYNCTLPCVKMPDVSDKVSCYLCIIPGIILSQVYHKYHQQILEMNVRTFLQFKGASNKGIRDTLIGHHATAADIRKGITDSDPEPDMFFSYNNGISATASDVVLNEQKNAIVKIRNWQIVNGGQTTAAISAVMNMKNVDIHSLSTVFVAMKVSVIKNPDDLTSIVPKISKFANTQSAIKKSDHNINEPFLIDIEQRSREEWVLNSNNKPISKWFFERTRGQYLDNAKHPAQGKTEKEFYAEYPKEQMIDKTFLSKFMMAWDQNPALVCKGGENNYSEFFTRTQRSGIRFDVTRYHRTIAKAILFKAIDAYYGKDGIQLPGYKSNMVAYTLALLSLLSDKSLNLDAIWKEQCVITPSVYNEMTISMFSVYAKLACGAEHITYKIKEPYTAANGKRLNKYIPREIPAEDIQKIKDTVLFKVLLFVKKIHTVIYDHIIKIKEGENINEWTKKSLCWDALKTKISVDRDKYQFPLSLCSAQGNLDESLTESQLKVIDQASQYPAETWLDIRSWSIEHPGTLTPKDRAFMGQVGYTVKAKKKLTFRQSKYALEILEKVEDAGWEDNK